MIQKHFITLILLVTLVNGSIFKINRVEPLKELKIDQNQFCLRSSKNKVNIRCLRPSCYVLEPPKEFDPVNLHVLYAASETGKFDGLVEFWDVDYEEIFAQNSLYTFTPAEWALYNRHIHVLEFYVMNVLGSSFCLAARSHFFMNNLAVLAIQYKNFRTLRFCVEMANYNLNYKGFLTLAAQHRATEEMLTFLLDDCGLREEIIQPFGADSTDLHPIEASIKFNNVEALKMFLSNGTPLGARQVDFPEKSALALIFKYDRKLMLRNILKTFPNCCKYTDFEGDGFLHYAAMYARSPGIVSFLFDQCPHLSVNSLNNAGMTPILLLLRVFSYSRMDVAIKFIEMGADLFSVTFNGPSPIEIIIQYSYVNIFEYIIETRSHDDVLLKRIVELIFKTESWGLLEILLDIRPDIPVSWVDLEKLNFDDILEYRHTSLFTLALRSKIIKIDKSIIEKIIQADSTRFLFIVFQYGAEYQMISRETLNRLQETQNNQMLGLIQGYTEEKIIITDAETLKINELSDFID